MEFERKVNFSIENRSKVMLLALRFLDNSKFDEELNG